MIMARVGAFIVIIRLIACVKSIQQAITMAIVLIFGEITDLFCMSNVLHIPKECNVILELIVLTIFLYRLNKILSYNSIEQPQNEIRIQI